MSEKDFQALARVLEGKESLTRVQRKDPHGRALREAGALYADREFVAAYERFLPVYESVVAEMQSFCERDAEAEAKRLARLQQISVASAKTSLEKKQANARQVIDQLNRLRQDLESKPLVKLHLRKQKTAEAAGSAESDGGSAVANETAASESAASETAVAPAPDTTAEAAAEIVVAGNRYRRAPYATPQVGNLYCVRDKVRGERIIRVAEVAADGTQVIVESVVAGAPAQKLHRLPVEALERQAAAGWCHLLTPVGPVDAPDDASEVEKKADALPAETADDAGNVQMRLDIQNFSRCCADIVRAKIQFDTQLIKDVGDGPFRAGNYEHAFRTFEQIALGFTTAVANSRRAIADGRRKLTAEKGKLSGKEIQERSAAFVRSEQLIHTAEREFSTILEGLRMYLRARLDEGEGEQEE